ncbi:MAG TPA: hypothetical protein VIM87_03455 [Chitinophaga sp.]|uniref:hypothetical protein n=1 Tax=Chitinophaga sp. TaxID=1869181 RepID=UPI002F93B1CA
MEQLIRQILIKIKTGCLCTILLCQGIPVLAQQPGWDVLQQICKEYDKADVMSFQSHIKLYAANKPSVIQSTLEVSCMINKEQAYTKAGPVEIIRNGQYLLTVDHEDKLLLVADLHTNQQKKDLQSQMFDVKRFLEDMQQSGAKAQKVMRGNNYWLELTSLTTPGMQQCNIMYDPGTFLVKRVWMQVAGEMVGAPDASVVDIAYDQYLFNAPDVGKFATARFVAINGKIAVLQEKYKNYTLINQL